MPSDDTPTRRADADDYLTRKGLVAGQTVFGRYTLRKILGRGGMGVVWLAHDEELSREVALKFLPEAVTTDRGAIADLKRETRRALELTHPHIVRIYDFVSDAHTAGISMEYVAGDTLSGLRADQPDRHFEVTDLSEWVRQLCEALDYAHTKAKVVHRDLKPANLMVDARGDLKIADFGISSSVADSVSRMSARVGTSGTPVYMSPQQMLGEKPAPTDDIYALGATLYELLTGKPPFHSGRIETQVMQKVPPSLAERRAELEVPGQPIPPAWEETIAACLAKDLAQRPQTAGEVAARLGLTGARGMVAGSSLVHDRHSATIAGLAKSRMSRVLLLVGLAVLALGVLAYSFWPKMRPALGKAAWIPPEVVFAETKAKAERGNAVVQTDLGAMYAKGNGVTKDSAAAVSWFRKAADQGYASAQHYLGAMYATGKGVPKDSTEAARWYRKAADQGYAMAQWCLGVVYATGDGVPKDRAEAVRWYRKAADQGNAYGQFSLGEVYATGDGVPKDSAEALRWYRKAADQGEAHAQCSLGVMYATGDGMPKDSAEAVRWFRKAADQGNADAQVSLGWMYEKGDGVPKDETEALAWYYLAAASGDETSRKNRDTLELRLGRQISLAAQQRSKEILKEIETAKTPSAGPIAVGTSLPKSSGTGTIVSAHGPDEGQAWTIPDLGLELVPISTGEFIMGSSASESGRSPDEGPQTRVTITRAFWLGKTEVTQGQWEALMGRNPSNFKGADRPVEQVSWNDAMEFCRKLTEREHLAGRLPEGFEYTLPTEAQWEYACRAGTTGEYGGGGNLGDMGWYSQNSGNTTHPVGQKQANAWGLYDMHGNVWEWCLDWYGNYPSGSVRDPMGTASGSRRVGRGGSWDYGSLNCRSTVRVGHDPGDRYFDLGFRLALSPASVAPSGGAVKAQQTITLFARDTVRVKLVQELDGAELFQGTLIKGESRSFTKRGSLLLTATALENIDIEVDGERQGNPYSGYTRVQIP